MPDNDVLKLNAELALQLANYWHEIDVNGGRNATAYYTEDAEFHGQMASYLGRAKIQQFYDWRVQQGPRLSIHSFTNFRAWFTGPDTAEATNYLCLYAANGVRILPKPSAHHDLTGHGPVQACARWAMALHLPAL